MKLFISLLIVLLSFSSNSKDVNTLTIDFEIDEYNNGKIYVAVYNSSTTFLKEPLTGTIVEVKNGKASAVIEGLKTGEYAVSSFYDKNGNGKLDTNFLGIPKEPTAMSNNAKGSFGPPKYKNAKFAFNAKKTIQIKY